MKTEDEIGSLINYTFRVNIFLVIIKLPTVIKS